MTKLNTEFQVGNIEASLVYDKKNNTAWLMLKRGNQEMSMQFKSIERLETFALRLYTSTTELWVKAVKETNKVKEDNNG
jgi:hypothetical protein